MFMRFGVLGPLAVWGEDDGAIAVPETKVRALLAVLLVHEGGPVSADRLIDELWGEALPAKPAGALQGKVSQLRRVLGRDSVLHQPAGYRLRLGPTPGRIDAHAFRALAAEARTAPDPRRRARLLTEALELWRGPAYADFADEPFALAAAQRLADERLAVQEEQAEARMDAGDRLLLPGELTALVQLHPLRERLRALHIRALYLAGRQTEALASYDDLRTRLVRELGVEPGPALAALHQAVLRQDARLDGPEPRQPAAAAQDTAAPGARPNAAAHRPPANLPTALTDLIGRGAALEELSRLLDRGRLVTLTGPGGVGKTSLAIAAAHTRGGVDTRLADGVWLVELAGVRAKGRVDDLAQVVASTLGISDGAVPAVPGTAAGNAGAVASPVHRLAAAVRGRRALLILDNCEHVIEAAAELTELILRSAPDVRVLATSREPLDLAGEAVYPVEPLDAASAVRLFTERAAARDPGFTRVLEHGGSADRDAVAAICRGLDGIPLALELAATRVRGLGVQELAVRLDDRFRVLTGGRRGAPARQQTLRALIDWSWELLGGPERILLRRLTVHSDGCDLAAAEAVCAGDGVERGRIAELISRLVDRSLVIAADGPAGRRYRLPESVAAYAAERLREAEDASALELRHLGHYLASAERAEPELRGAGQRSWLIRLDADAGNLRAALDEALSAPDQGRTRQAVRLVTALSWWWLLRGRFAEAHRALCAVAALPAAGAEAEPELALLHAAFAHLSGDRGEGTQGARTNAAAITDPVRRGRALWLYAYGGFSTGDVAGSEELNAQALELFVAARDRWGTAAALGLRATLALVRGDLSGAGRDGGRSAAIFHELGDRWGELQTVSPLAALAEILGDYLDAADRERAGLALARDLGLAAEVSARLSGLGRLALLERDWQRGRELHEKARRIAIEQGYTYGVLHSEMGLALGARRSGDLAAAQAHLLHIRDTYTDVSSAAGEHLLEAELGFIAELRGDGAAAAGHHLCGLIAAESLGEPRALALSLEGLAGAARLLPDPEAAATTAALLLGAADATRRRAGAPLPEGEKADTTRIAAAARQATDPATYADAFHRGAQLTAAEAVRHARAVIDELSQSSAVAR